MNQPESQDHAVVRALSTMDESVIACRGTNLPHLSSRAAE